MPRRQTLNHFQGGPRGGPALLLIHPMGADHSFWEDCREIWQSDYHCVAVDLRGAGASPDSPEPLSIEDHARDLASLCEDLGLDRVVPVGCAVGAMVATAFTGLHPSSCRALVLSNPGYRTTPEARAHLTRRAADVRAGGMAAVIPAAIDSAFVDCPFDDRRERYLRSFARQDPIRYALQIEGMLDADTSPYAEKIACPTLIVAGGRDGLLPPEHARQINAAVRHSDFVLVPEGAHFMPYQRPIEFAKLVSSFLRRSLQSAGRRTE